MTSNTYYDWFIDQAYLVLAGARRWSAEFLETFRSSRRGSSAASFTIDQAMEKLRGRPLQRRGR